MVVEAPKFFLSSKEMKNTKSKLPVVVDAMVRRKNNCNDKDCGADLGRRRRWRLKPPHLPPDFKLFIGSLPFSVDSPQLAEIFENVDTFLVKGWFSDFHGRDYNCEVAERSIGEALGNCLEGDWQRREKKLSIEIARKFFDLQDMLGFDKASNTLKWLLTKSKRAIKELDRSKQQSSSGNNNGGGVTNYIKNFSSSSFHEGKYEFKQTSSQ
ncbi:hypothetical protein PIB30_037557, partial [Stylosanthes scabra]|nr:hypothetical protein [Stylosanthes scabra]